MKKLTKRIDKFKGLCVGLDLHKRFIQVSVLDAQGQEVQAARLAATPQALEQLMQKLKSQGQPLRVALEAGGCFMWAYDLLAQWLGQEAVAAAAPSQVRVIAQAGEKTDATDAWWLAYLLHEGRLPQALVAQGDLRELRIASRELRSVIDQRSDLMRRLRSHLAQLGLSFAKSHWASVAGRQKIAQLVKQIEAPQGMRGQAVARLWRRIEELGQEVEHWRKAVAQRSECFAQVKLLTQQLAGIGPQTAAVVWSELGDPRRYRSAKAYAKATGLTPGYRESGGRRSRRSITRQGSAHVRWALTRAILACSRCTRGPGLAVKHWVARLGRRKSKKAAMVAAARKLAEGVWRLFALGEAFDLSRAFAPGRAPAPAPAPGRA